MAWLTPVILICSVLVALASLATQRLIAKRRAAYDFLENITSSERYLVGKQAFNHLVSANALNTLASSSSPAEPRTRDHVAGYLDLIELLCVSIEFRVIDEEICKAQIGREVARQFFHASALIEQLREIDQLRYRDETQGRSGNANLPVEAQPYFYFETVALRWRDNLGRHRRNVFGEMWDSLVRVNPPGK